MKVTNISPPETIVDPIGQILRITKVLAFDNNLSIRINFYHDLAEVPQNNKTYSIYLLTDSQLQFLKILKDNGTHENRNR